MKGLTLILGLFAVNLPFRTFGCEAGYEFEGFGVNLGSIDSFTESQSPNSTIALILDQVYNDLGIRFFRTHYEKDFSPSPNIYEIPSTTDYHKTWNAAHSQLSTYANISLMVSITSPPQHMKNNSIQTLPIEQEQNYLKFILAINQLMKDHFNLTVERVSPINDPLTGIPVSFLPNYTFMTPKQLCRMVKDFDNPVISLCPEKTFYWTSLYYANFRNNTNRVTCIESCDIIATHGYSLYVDIQTPDIPNILKLYYDHKQYERRTTKPIWQTEVSSNLNSFQTNEIQEAVDFAVNIANFLGFMCVQRYYYYHAYTSKPSGQSLIWGNPSANLPGESLTFPKKYFAFKHFSTASQVWPVNITSCDPHTFFGTFCTQFGTSRAVFTNSLDESVPLNWYGVPACKPNSFYCTTSDEDWSPFGTVLQDNGPSQVNVNILPPKSICSCDMEPSKDPPASSSSHKSVATFPVLITLILSIVFLQTVP